MVDRDVFDRRLGALEGTLRDLRELVENGRKAFLADRGLKAQAERWAHLAVESTLDLAHQLIAEQGWESPSTNREAFGVLHRHGVIDEAMTAQMAAWAGLRNVLVHIYLDVDHSLLFDILHDELDQLATFAGVMAGYDPGDAA